MERRRPPDSPGATCAARLSADSSGVRLRIRPSYPPRTVPCVAQLIRIEVAEPAAAVTHLELTWDDGTVGPDFRAYVIAETIEQGERMAAEHGLELERAGVWVPPSGATRADHLP